MSLSVSTRDPVQVTATLSFCAQGALHGYLTFPLPERLFKVDPVQALEDVLSS